MHSVLLIDDDPAVLHMLENAFRRAGYAVVAASSGEGGLSAYARDATDLVILDVNLPDVSGLDLLARLRALDAHATVIVLTGQAAVLRIIGLNYAHCILSTRDVRRVGDDWLGALKARGAAQRLLLRWRCTLRTS